MTSAQARLARPGSDNVWRADLICDIWAPTHIANPFFIYCMTQSWPITFLFTGVAEIAEGVLVAGGTAFPLEVSESLTEVLIDDWLIQGGLGLLLGGLFMYTIKAHALLSSKRWRTRRSEWYFYALIVVLYFLANVSGFAGFYVEAPPDTRNLAGFNTTDLWLSPAVNVAYHGILLTGVYAVEPHFSTQVWLGEPPWKRSSFWCGAWVIGAALELQAPWDYFYSSAIQSWLITAIIALYLLGIAAVRGEWPYFVQRFGSWAWQREVQDVVKLK